MIIAKLCKWETVRVIRYRQHKPNGQVMEAYCLTNFSSHEMSRRCLYAMAKSRWRIENEGFNDAKNRYGLEHIRHHHQHSLLIVWLLTCFALILKRLHRLRYLHRGSHPVRTAIHLLRLLALSLSILVVTDSSCVQRGASSASGESFQAHLRPVAQASVDREIHPAKIDHDRSPPPP